MFGKCINILLIVTLFCTQTYCSSSDIMEDKHAGTWNKQCEKCEDKLNKLQAEVSRQQHEVNSLRTEDTKQKSELKVLRASDIQRKSEVSTLQTKLNAVEKLVISSKPSIGVSYTRWGRTTCPKSVTVVYKGYMGGSWYKNEGGGGNYVCLPENPEWGNRENGLQYLERMHGVEYQSNNYEHILSRKNNAGISLSDYDAVCVQCFIPTRSTQIMIPARRTCPAGWTMEYRGYLATEHGSHNNKDYICLDEEPEATPGSSRDWNGALLYAVEGECRSLPCPPYVSGWELTCVVCSK